MDKFVAQISNFFIPSYGPLYYSKHYFYQQPIKKPHPSTSLGNSRRAASTHRRRRWHHSSEDNTAERSSSLSRSAQLRATQTTAVRTCTPFSYRHCLLDVADHCCSNFKVVNRNTVRLASSRINFGFWNQQHNMFGTTIRFLAQKPKPKMGPIELKTPLEQRQTITRVLFDIVKEHGPLTIQDTWEHVKEVGLKDLTSKRHMKIVLRWMRERQKLRLICNHVGAHKQFLYTTWFTKPSTAQAAVGSFPVKQKNPS